MTSQPAMVTAHHSLRQHRDVPAMLVAETSSVEKPTELIESKGRNSRPAGHSASQSNYHKQRVRKN